MLTSHSIQPIPMPVVHEAPVKLLKFSRTGNWLVSGDTAMKLALWYKGEPQHRVDLLSNQLKFRSADRIRAVSWGIDERTFFVAAGAHLRGIDLDTGLAAWTYQAPNHYCFLATSPCDVLTLANGCVVATFDDGAMEVRAPDGFLFTRWRDNDMPLRLARMPDGTRVFGSDGFRLTLWDPEIRRKLRYRTIEDRIYGLGAVDHKPWAYLRTTHEVQVWNMENMTQLHGFRVEAGNPLVVPHPGGEVVATTELNGVSIRNLTGVELARLELEGDRIVTAAWDPLNGDLLAGTGSGSVVRYLAKALPVP